MAEATTTKRAPAMRKAGGPAPAAGAVVPTTVPTTVPTSTVVKVIPATAAAPGAVDPSDQAVLDRLLHGAAAATLIYGDTGSGKTTLLATYARWIWKRFRVPTRLYAFDPGGYSDDVLALIKLGIIEVWRVYTRDPQAERGLPSETLQRACQGWWPAEIDPATGACPLAAKLVPPAPGERFAACFDGLSGMCDWSMVDMGQRQAKGTLGGEGSNMKTVDSGELHMGMGNRASVGFTQAKVRDWVLSSISIPGLVAPPVFTALEKKVNDSETKLPLYGPQIAGQAKTADVPAWFGATLGACLAKDPKTGGPQWRLYLRDYNWPKEDPTPHKAKIRSSAALPAVELARLPDYLADEAGEEPLTRFNLGHLFEVLEDVRLKTLAKAAEEFPDAPGLKASTIGTGVVVTHVGPGGPVGVPAGGAGRPAGVAPATNARPSAIAVPAVPAVPAAPVTAPAAAPPPVADAPAPAPVAPSVPVSPVAAPAVPAAGPVVAAAAPPPASAPTVTPTQVLPAIPPVAPARPGRPAPAGFRPSPVPRAPIAAAPASKQGPQ